MLALIVAIVNSVAGLAIAFVLVRDDFRGKAFVSALIDLPFALPTIVAGLTLLALYGANSPFHVDLAGTRLGIGAALLFVTLPFCVRSVQPVLAELDRGDRGRGGLARRDPAPGAAADLVAERLCRRCWPAPGLAFARAIGEFGSVVLISGNLPFKTEVASSWIFSLSQSDDLPAASAVSVVLVLIALIVLLASAGPAAASTSRRRCDVKAPAGACRCASACWAISRCSSCCPSARSSTGRSSTGSARRGTPSPRRTRCTRCGSRCSSRRSPSR